MEDKSSFPKSKQRWKQSTSRIRLLALDVDGTVLTADHRVAASTYQAIQMAIEYGTIVILASSRSPSGLHPVLTKLETDNLMIAYQGALVCRLGHDYKLDVLAENRVPLESARAVLHEALDLGLSVGWYAGNEWIVPKVDAAIVREAKIVGEEPVTDTNLASRDEEPHKLLCVADDKVSLAALRRLSTRLPSELVGNFSHGNYLEVTHRDAEKGQALLVLCRSLGISLAEVAAIGDGDNDVTMLQVAGFGVAMGQSPMAVKVAADWITDTNEQDGVALAVEKMLGCKL